MPVKITDDMHDAFTKKGFSETDIQNTVDHYRNAGQSDEEITNNLNKKYQEFSQKTNPETYQDKTPEQWEQQRQQIEGGKPEIAGQDELANNALMLALPEAKVFKGAGAVKYLANKAITGGMWGGAQSVLDKAEGKPTDLIGNIGTMAAANTILGPAVDYAVKPATRFIGNEFKKAGGFITDEVGKVGSKFAKKAESKMPIDAAEYEKLADDVKDNYTPVAGETPQEKTLQGNIFKTVPNIAKNTIKGLSKSDINNIADETGNIPYDDYYYHVSTNLQDGKIPAFKHNYNVNSPVVWMSDRPLGDIEGHVYAIPKELVSDNLGKSPNRFHIYEGDLPLEKTLYLGKNDVNEPFDLYNAFQNAEHPTGIQETIKPIQNSTNDDIFNQPPNYFDHRKIEIDHTKKLDDVAQDIRNVHSSNVNSTINEAAYLKDDLENLLTDDENNAVGLRRDFNKDPEQIKEAIQSGLFNENHLKMALNPTENMKKADAMLTDAYGQAANKGLENGTFHQIKDPDTYINRLYENSSNPASAPDENFLHKTSKNAKQRSYLNPLEAMQNGEVFKSFKASDRVEPYFADKAKVFANRDLLEALKESPLSKYTSPKNAPDGYNQFVSEHLPTQYLKERPANDNFNADEHYQDIEKNYNDALKVAKSSNDIETGASHLLNNIPKQDLPHVLEKYYQNAKNAIIGKETEPLYKLKLNEQGNPIPYERNLYIPKRLSDKLKPITDAPINLADKHPILDKLQKTQDLVKTGKLSFSFFHDKAMGLVHIYQNCLHPKGFVDVAKFYTKADKYLSAKDFRKNERDLVRYTGTTSHLQSNADILQKITKTIPGLEKYANKPAMKQLLDFQDKRADFLFGKFQRLLKVNNYADNVKAWKLKNPNANIAQLEQAKTQIARQVNSAYGGLNWEAIGRTPMFRAVARAVCLAPDWTYSNFDFFKQGLIKGVGGDMTRNAVLASVIGGGIATEMMNWSINGHFTDKNKQGHQFEAQLPNGQYLSFFPGQSGDAIKLISKITSDGAVGVSEFAQNKLNAAGQAGVIAGTGRDYRGQSISNNGMFGKGKGLNAFQKTGNYATAVASPFIPLPISFASTTNQLYANGERNPAMYAPAMLGLTSVRPDKK